MPTLEAPDRVVVGAYCGFFLASLVFAINRIYVKLALMKRLSWDDVTLLIAFLLIMLFFAASMWGYAIGTWPKYMEWSYPQYLTWILTRPILLFLKATFFLLYTQLFYQVLWIRVASWSGLLLSSATYFALSIWAFAISNVHGAGYFLEWMPTMGVPMAAVGLVFDVWILVLPIAGIWGLQISRTRKLGLLITFLCGFLGCVAAACNIYFRLNIGGAKLDMRWKTVPITITTWGEMCIGSICACMPSAHYAAKHSHSIYRRFLRKTTFIATSPFTSKLRTFKSGTKSGDGKRSSHDLAHNSLVADALKSTDRKYAQYFELAETKVAVRSKDDSRMESSLGSKLDPREHKHISAIAATELEEGRRTVEVGKGIWRQVDVEIDRRTLAKE